MAIGVTTGTTITIGSFTAEVLDISGLTLAGGSVQTSHQGSVDWHSFIPTKLTDPGELTFDINFDPAATLPPVNGDPETITVDYAGQGGASQWIFEGFMTGFEITGPLEDKMTASVTIKATGAVTKGT